MSGNQWETAHGLIFSAIFPPRPVWGVAVIGVLVAQLCESKFRLNIKQSQQ